MRNTEWIKESYFAHRGLHNNKKNIPENSLLAFKIAISKGYGLELDLRFIADKSLIIFHDQTLERLSKSNVVVDEQNYNELKKFKLLDSEEHIPLFTDLLDVLSSKTPVLIEFKSTERYKEMVDCFIEIMKSREQTYAIQSFDPRILNYFKKRAPEILRGQIAESQKSRNTFSNILLNLFIATKYNSPDFINYHLEDLPNKKLDKLRKKGMTIISYTARSQKSFDFVKSRYDNSVFEGFEPKK